jgi:hypothetical protein
MALTPPSTPWTCAGCGYVVWGGVEPDVHDCDRITAAAQLDRGFRAWLGTPAGQFATYLARRST